MELKIEDTRKKDREAVDKGLWKTGNAKYVDINTIDDPEYLQKIIYTLNHREEKIHDEIARAISKLEVVGKFYIHLLNRIKTLKDNHELTKDVRFLKTPLYDTVCDKDLEKLKGKIKEILLSLEVNQ